MIRAYSESMVSSNTESLYPPACSRCLQLCFSGSVMRSFAFLQNEKRIQGKELPSNTFSQLTHSLFLFTVPELHFSLPGCGTRDDEDFTHVPSEHTARVRYIHGCLCSDKRRKYSKLCLCNSHIHFYTILCQDILYKSI